MTNHRYAVTNHRYAVSNHPNAVIIHYYTGTITISKLKSTELAVGALIGVGCNIKAGNTFSGFHQVFCQVFKVFNLLLDLSGQQLISGWPDRAS